MGMNLQAHNFGGQGYGSLPDKSERTNQGLKKTLFIGKKKRFLEVALNRNDKPNIIVWLGSQLIEMISRISYINKVW